MMLQTLPYLPASRVVTLETGRAGTVDHIATHPCRCGRGAGCPGHPTCGGHDTFWFVVFGDPINKDHGWYAAEDLLPATSRLSA